MVSDEESSEDSEDGDPFSENEAKDYLYQLLQALKYLRDRKIIHRDIKPENLLITEDGIIKLCDFGWATDAKSHSIVGTCDYNAPEMVKGKEYDYKSDIWSFGVVMFEFLYRKRPFHGENERETESKIRHGRYTFPDTPNLSEECKHLLKWILRTDPAQRPDIEDIEDHPWMATRKR
jgi:serine/threonine protein kinase